MQKVAENSKAIFYKNDLCKPYRGFNILIGENKKSKKKEYLLIKNQKIIYASQKIEDVAVRADILILDEQFSSS